MGLLYPAKLPVDSASNVMQDFPSPIKAKKVYGANAAVSSVVTLTEDTTTIEVAAIGGAGVAIKWIPTTDTAASVIAMGASANYDHVVPANWRQRFVVPIERQTTPGSVQGLNKLNGLYSRVAWIATAAPSSSVMASEF